VPCADMAGWNAAGVACAASGKLKTRPGTPSRSHLKPSRKSENDQHNTWVPSRGRDWAAFSPNAPATGRPLAKTSSHLWPELTPTGPCDAEQIKYYYGTALRRLRALSQALAGRAVVCTRCSTPSRLHVERWSSLQSVLTTPKKAFLGVCAHVHARKESRPPGFRNCQPARRPCKR